MNTKKSSSRWVLAAAIALTCATPLVGMAQDATTRPSAPSSGEGEQRSSGERRWDRGDGERSRRWGRRNSEPVTEDQWQQVMAFMKQHSPRRAEELEKISSDSSRAMFMRNLVRARYDFMMSLKNDEQGNALYELQVNKMETEDAIYGVLLDSQKKSDTITDADKAKLRDLVSKLVDTNFKEREHRIVKLERSLDDARKSLDRDKTNKDSVVDNRLNQFLNDGPSKMDVPAGPGQGGPGERRGPDRDAPGVKIEPKPEATDAQAAK